MPIPTKNLLSRNPGSYVKAIRKAPTHLTEELKK